MIVRQFLHWVRNAPAGMRAEATGALTRTYLYSDLSAEELAAAEGAMLMMLDDPSPLVRRALAEGLADSPHAPPTVVHALANDQAEIAAVVLEHSVLFIDADLVEMVATGNAPAQAAIARRAHLPRAVAAAIAEVGSAESCLILIENPDADIAQFSIDRIAERFGTLAAIRESLLARHDLPASTRHALVAKLSEALASFVTARRWLEPGRVQRVVKEACEKAAVTIAADEPHQARALVQHLRAVSQLNVGLLLRALLSGNTALFEEALAELSDVPLARVHGIVHDRSIASFCALYEKAGLPASTYPAFREAVVALREANYQGALSGASRLKRRLIERVLTGCEQSELGEIEPLLMLLRRFATEAAREEARVYCDVLVTQEDSADEFEFEHDHAADADGDLVYDYEAHEAQWRGEAPHYAAQPEMQQPLPGSTEDWPQVHFEAGEGPQFELAHAPGYEPQQLAHPDVAAWEPTAYGEAAYGAPSHEPPVPRDPLIEFYYQHLGPEPEVPAYVPANDPLLHYRPGQDRIDPYHAARGPLPHGRYERAAA